MTNSAPMLLVDCQSHWYMQSYLESILGRTRHPRAERREGGGYLFEARPGGLRFPFAPHLVDLDLQLAEMDELGIDAVVTSPSILGEVADLELSAARAKRSTFINEASAQAQKDQRAQEQMKMSDDANDHINARMEVR
jgi:hypothetical protein